jgi:hypothetical protein
MEKGQRKFRFYLALHKLERMPVRLPPVQFVVVLDLPERVLANAQTANSSTTITVQIVNNAQGETVFSPNAITVKFVTQVTIVNHPKVRELVIDNDPRLTKFPNPTNKNL